MSGREGQPPRVRGRHTYHDWHKHATVGQPPRVRGRRIRRGGLTVGGRTTPAGAGTTGTERARVDQLRDNPRGCGDDTETGKPLTVRQGQPPRVRGRQAG